VVSKIVIDQNRLMLFRGTTDGCDWTHVGRCGSCHGSTGIDADSRGQSDQGGSLRFAGQPRRLSPHGM